MKPRDHNPSLFRDNVRKSWAVMAHVVKNISDDALVMHRQPLEGLEYDCLSLATLDRNDRPQFRVTMNRNGVNCDVLPWIWRRVDEVGAEAVALELIAAAGLERSPQARRTETGDICDQVVAWIDAHQHEEFYVGPLNWPGSCRELLDVPPPDDPEPSQRMHNPVISLGIGGREVARFQFGRGADPVAGSAGAAAGQLEDKYFAYIYRHPQSLQVLYVGYGTRPGRAYSVGHNRKIANVVESGEGFEILIAGPYRDEEEARNVEAALVSALSPDFNLIQQPGLKFRHLGIPNDLGSRRAEPPLSIHDIGIQTGGALIVYLSATAQLKSGDAKLTPINFDDETVFNNIRGHWYVRKFIPQWLADPSTSPRALVAVQGPVKDRIVVASCAIDPLRWGTTPTAPWDSTVHEVPLFEDQGLDVAQVRGRRIDAKFGQGKANYIMWVGGDGFVKHG